MAQRKTSHSTDEAGAQRAPFTHYSKEALAFLVELSANNERDWFKQNQERYETLVREPTRAFVRAMQPLLADISRHVVASDKKVGGSMMRPQRDTRFGANKDPYKTNVGVQFRHSAGKDVHAPGFYFHFDLDEVFLGVGLWRPEAEALGSIRAQIDKSPKKWLALFKATHFGKNYQLGGDSLKRAPKGFPVDHPQIEVLKRKDFIAVHHFPASKLFRGDLPTFVAKRFAEAKPFMAFLHQAIGLKF